MIDYADPLQPVDKDFILTTVPKRRRVEDIQEENFQLIGPDNPTSYISLVTNPKNLSEAGSGLHTRPDQ